MMYKVLVPRFGFMNVTVFMQNRCIVTFRGSAFRVEHDAEGDICVTRTHDNANVGWFPTYEMAADAIIRFK